MRKMNESKISVIVPVYNVERYLERCLNSIINQTYQNLEIIVVDDGSKDHSGILADKIAQSDARIKVIHKRNGGLSDARNAGLDIATGAFIGFVDSDDYIEPVMYERLFEACKKSNAAIAICGRFQESEESGQRKEMFTCEKTIVSGKEAAKKLLLYDNCDSAAWDKLYSSELFEKMRYPYGVLHEDLNFTIRLLFRCEKVAYIGAPLYHYMVRENSICKQPFTSRRFDLYNQASLCREYVNIICPELSKAADYFVFRNARGVLISAADSAKCEKADRKKINKIVFSELRKMKKNPFVKREEIRVTYRRMIKMFVKGCRMLSN